MIGRFEIRFEPYLTREPNGRAVFANHVGSAPTFRQRCWPVLQPFRRSRRAKRHQGWRSARLTAVIKKDARLTVARRCMPCNPLDAHAMRVEDTRRGRRPLGRS
jgi:hypothetical protein